MFLYVFSLPQEYGFPQCSPLWLWRLWVRSQRSWWNCRLALSQAWWPTAGGDHWGAYFQPLSLTIIIYIYIHIYNIYIYICIIYIYMCVCVCLARVGHVMWYMIYGYIWHYVYTVHHYIYIHINLHLFNIPLWPLESLKSWLFNPALKPKAYRSMIPPRLGWTAHL